MVNCRDPPPLTRVSLPANSACDSLSRIAVHSSPQRAVTQATRDPYCSDVATTTAIPPGQLRTEGARIVGGDGGTVRLAGVNWYGAEGEHMVPGGLDRRSVDDVCAMIVGLGFNHIRLPYCDQLVFDNPPISSGLDANPALQGRSALEVVDAVIASAARHGLRVVIDNHRSDAGWSAQGNGLWYSKRFSEARWLQSLRFMAERYRGDETVIGIDLRNEPGSPAVDGEQFPRNGGAAWGQPDGRTMRWPRDWAAAAERGGNAVLSINPRLLVFVEGVRSDPAGPVIDGRHHTYWPGGNLCGVRSAGGRRRAPRPITLQVAGRLVYSVHDYGPDMHREMPWCQLTSTARTPDACRSVWEQTWGFIARHGIAPVYVGEFGTPNGLARGDTTAPHLYTDTNAVVAQGAWFSHLVAYMNELQVSWAYWALNGDQSAGVGRSAGEPDWYGVLTPDWSGPASEPMMAKLSTMQVHAAGGR